MDTVKKIGQDANGSGRCLLLITAGDQTRVTVRQTTITAASNNERATKVGPVLEEILHRHWNHWGLNE